MSRDGRPFWPYFLHSGGYDCNLPLTKSPELQSYELLVAHSSSPEIQFRLTISKYGERAGDWVTVDSVLPLLLFLFRFHLLSVVATKAAAAWSCPGGLLSIIGIRVAGVRGSLPRVRVEPCVSSGFSLNAGYLNRVCQGS